MTWNKIGHLWGNNIITHHPQLELKLGIRYSPIYYGACYMSAGG